MKEDYKPKENRYKGGQEPIQSKENPWEGHPSDKDLRREERLELSVLRSVPQFVDWVSNLALKINGIKMEDN